MVFSSTIFIFFLLPLALFFYFSAPKRLQNSILLIASLLFYYWGEKQFVLVLLFSICVNYIAGRAIQHSKQLRVKKVFLFLGVLLNILILFSFKYLNFTVENIVRILPQSVSFFNGIPQTLLAAGISFFTFQGISYIVDIYRGEKSRSNILDIALYISFFPQLIAGPIIQYKDIAYQLEKRNIRIDDFAYGLERFIFGLSKKVLLADTLGIFVDEVFQLSPEFVQSPYLWIGAAAYTLQIYLDFSGYSDMAIGLARMFGFRFLENFNRPYISQSITEFWRRWHISLSSWFKEYVYIPLGGNRNGNLTTYRNLITVFFLCGLWHGASWHFVLWGIWHGIFLVLEKAFFLKILKKMPAILNQIYMLTIVISGWILFRSPNITFAKNYIERMLYKPSDFAPITIFISQEFLVIFLISIFITFFPKRFLKQWGSTPHFSFLKYGSLLILFILCVLSIVSSSYQPFIYYKF